MSAIVARKSFQPANEDVNRLEKGSAIKLIGWYILVKLFEGFSVKFAQRIYMFITLRLEIIFDTLKRLIVDKIPTQFNLPGKNVLFASVDVDL